jgi:hypothetical protein
VALIGPGAALLQTGATVKQSIKSNSLLPFELVLFFLDISRLLHQEPSNSFWHT